MRPNRYSRRPPRTAFTLIEMIIVLSVLSSVLAGAIALTIVMQQSLRRADENLAARQQLVRFADDFRKDFHRSQRHRFESGTLTLQFDAGQPDVVYQIDQNSVHRTAKATDTENERHDSYTFGPRLVVEPASDDKADAFGFRMMGFEDQTKNQSGPRHVFEILAVRRPTS